MIHHFLTIKERERENIRIPLIFLSLPFFIYFGKLTKGEIIERGKMKLLYF